MNFGKLDRRVVIQQRTVSGRSAVGGDVFTWVTVATVWASYEALRGQEFLAAHQQQAETVGRYRIRYRTGIAKEMRVVDGATIHDIEAVLPVFGRKVALELMVKEGLTDG